LGLGDDAAPLPLPEPELDPEPEPEPEEPDFADAVAEKLGVKTADGLAIHEVAAARAVSAGALALTTPFPEKEQAEAVRPFSS